ncbi:MAG: 23S rRNA (guanosine(2251)-2'-O)-methyltransferase RlmB [Chitinivibrionales bacterium]|nr:23S rRNA (guanosine(2251)-2'-O)-methyltransferase RlmB [Chitinivibrionales bacterium]MBD3356911.1 23S rRNA (guanosine(2251)-2'-O)-methyltransferase RlmB [Chitinivibrionales bacterium]
MYSLNTNRKVSVHHSGDIVHGIHAVEGLLDEKARRVERVYFDSSRQSRSGPLFSIRKRCRRERIPTQAVPAIRLTQLAGTAKHQGVAALCTVKDYADIEHILAGIRQLSSPLLLVPASIEDPGNLGSIIRSAAAFGVDAIMLERKNTVPLNATVAKNAVGMLERINIAKPRNLEGILGELKNEGHTIVGAIERANRPPSKVDLTGPTILIVGGEHRAIPPYLKKSCTHLVGIPEAAGAASLNVSAATAALLYECSRQRGFRYRENDENDKLSVYETN